MNNENSDKPQTEIPEDTPAFFDILKVTEFVNPNDKTKVQKNNDEEKLLNTSGEDSDYSSAKPKKRRRFFKKQNLYCEYCSFNCSSLQSLAIHSKKHLVEYKTCTHCDLTFTCVIEFKGHMREKHGNESLTCSFCEKKFYTAEAVIAHTKATKCGEEMHKKLLKCRECSFSTTGEQSMNTHAQYHGAGKNHQCDYCSYSSNVQATYLLHVDLHNEEMEEKSFECGYCDKIFNSVSSLKEHFITHKNDKDFFECEICPFKCVALA